LGFNLFGEQDFDEAGGLGRAALGVRAGAGGEEARGQDAGVVEDEEIAGLEELREVGEEVVAECAGGVVRTSIRLEPRWAGGCWAMSSTGRS